MARTAKPAPSIPPFKFTDGEIQALADLAWKAWETGSEHATTDRLGARWRFLVEREPPPVRLEVVRTYQEAEPEGFTLNGAELGVDHIRADLASRILALLEPHVGRRNAQPAAPL